LAVALASAALIALSMGPGLAGAQVPPPLHGIGLSKGCLSTTRIGHLYTCNYSITNSTAIDEAGDTLTITSLVDTVNGPPGSPTSGNILASPGAFGGTITFETLPGNTGGPASCTGLGTATPLCTLPSQPRIRITGV